MNRPMTKRTLFCVVLLALWVGIFSLGIKLYSGVRLQGVPGFPNADQTRLYLVFPAAMLVFNIFLLAFIKKIPRTFLVLVAVAHAFLIPVLLILFGGGV